MIPRTFLLSLSLLSFAVAVASHAQPCRQPIAVGPRTPLVVSSAAPSGVLAAAEDLATDMEKVFGSKPSVLHQMPASAPSAIVIGEVPGTRGLLQAGAPAESFGIDVECPAGRNGLPRVHLAGADMRGTVFAIYQFSQQFLGVDPMYFWTDNQPRKRASLTIPANFRQLFPAPVFRYRGFFINDEDLLTGWAPGPPGEGTGISTIKPGAGAYFHIAMMNNEANQLTEMVSPERILSEQARLQKAGATSVFLVNTSDIRPVAMTARATMQFAWSGAQGATSDEYLRQWAEEEFGTAAAPAVIDAYHKYYAAPAYLPTEAHRGEQPRVYGDQIYHTEAREMMLSAMLNFPLAYLQDQAPKWAPPHITGSGSFARAVALANREVKVCAEAAPRWDAAWQVAQAAESQVPPERKPFYDAEVLTIAIQRESNAALLSVSNAILAKNGRDLPSAIRDAQQAQDALDRILAQEHSVEIGLWQHWYHGD